jgi:tetratricopeptide repeat protein
MSSEQSAAAKKRCFVVMGFGKKTDFATGRTLDLDKSYRLLIKPVVEEKDIICVRADEIRHSGAIDVPMYRELLSADIVVADLSTANPNALYELGVRHALRPFTTVVIAENKLTYPFDLNHVAITSYTHLGEAIDFEEVMRFRKALGEMLDAVLKTEESDSPVYTFLDLTPPALVEKAKAAAAAAADAAAKPAANPATAAAADATLAVLVAQGENAIKTGNFSSARAFFDTAAEIAKVQSNDPKPKAIAHDPYLTQRLALATYKAEQPDVVSALTKALEILKPLDPDESNDPETVGLAGAIEKRLYEAGKGAEHLGDAIWYYGRGFYLRNDWYNGINLAFLLNLRTDSTLDPTDQDKIADLVWANRIRRRVVALCAQELKTLGSQSAEAVAAAGADLTAARQERAEAETMAAASWMMGSFNKQIGKLEELLRKHGHLLNPPWKPETAAKP